MKKNISKFACLAFALMLVLQSPATASAAGTQNVTTNGGTASITVSAIVDQTFTVTVPQSISLIPEDVVESTITLSGKITESDTLVISVPATVTLSDSTGDNGDTTYTAAIYFNEIESIQSVSFVNADINDAIGDDDTAVLCVSTPDLPAGTWEGSFDLTVSVN